LVPGPFVERHGLMLLIALGESVLAIGVGLGTGAVAIGAEHRSGGPCPWFLDTLNPALRERAR